MTDHDIPGLDHFDHGIATTSQGGVLANALAVPRTIDRDRLMAPRDEFGDQLVPAPRAVETAMNQNEPPQRLP